MIYGLRGKIAMLGESSVVVETRDGVFWEAEVSTMTRQLLAGGNREECFVHTYLHHREDQMLLFGFHDAGEKEMFLLLNKVNGIGPRQGMKLLGAADYRRIAAALADGDSDFLTSLPGLGPKGAGKMILAIKDAAKTFLETHAPDFERSKTSASAESGEADNSHLVDALIQMGFDRREASRAVSKVTTADPQAAEGEILRRCIVELS